MKIERVVYECRTIRRELKFDFMALMRITYGMTFVITEVIDRILKLDEHVDESKLMKYIQSDLTTRATISLSCREQLSLLLRLLAVDIFLPRLNEKEEFEIPFQTIESATIWALTSFWSVAIYGTADSVARFYADKEFEHPMIED